MMSLSSTDPGLGDVGLGGEGIIPLLFSFICAIIALLLRPAKAETADKNRGSPTLIAWLTSVSQAETVLFN